MLERLDIFEVAMLRSFDTLDRATQCRLVEKIAPRLNFEEQVLENRGTVYFEHNDIFICNSCQLLSDLTSRVIQIMLRSFATLSDEENLQMVTRLNELAEKAQIVKGQEIEGQ